MWLAKSLEDKKLFGKYAGSTARWALCRRRDGRKTQKVVKTVWPVLKYAAKKAGCGSELVAAASEAVRAFAVPYPEREEVAQAVAVVVVQQA